MGRKSIPCELIENNYQRNVCYRKRVKGLIKKAVELSVICNQDIEIVISNKQKDEIVVFSAEGEFNYVNLKSILQDSR